MLNDKVLFYFKENWFLKIPLSVAQGKDHHLLEPMENMRKPAIVGQTRL